MHLKIRPWLFLGLLASLALSVPASAGTCTDLSCQFNLCASPAFGVASQLWGELQPTDVGQLPANRDNTNFNPITGPYNETEPRWMSVDIEGDTLFAAINFGLQVWDVSGTNASNPAQLAVLGRNQFPYWKPGSNEEKNPVRDLDAPPGNDSVLAVALVNDSGLSVFDTSTPRSPIRKYSDRDRNALAVYSTRIGGTDYAFLATRDHGATVYNLTTAKNLGSNCVDDSPSQVSCGPYVSRMGSRNIVNYVDGVDTFVVLSFGLSDRGLELYNVANPASPQRLFTALTNDFVQGVALWKKGASYYLGAVVHVSGGIQARIYNMSCLATGSCSGLGPQVWSQNLPSGGTEFFLTYSKGNGRDFLSLGGVNNCSQLTQNEWLFDATTPASTTDITPPDAFVSGQLTGYWGWYYRRNPTGFNNTSGRVGKFDGQYFYRAAFNIFDVHELTSSAPAADFVYAPSTVYQGEPIDFTDTSSGGPTSFSWSFQDATPSSSSAENPQNVVFNSTGTKSVTLDVANGFGSDSITQQIPVLDPDPIVSSVSVSPNPALVCQPITFTANGISGLPPLAFSWDVQDGSGTVATGGNVNPFVWDSTGFADGQYTATVTVTNSSGNDTSTSPTLNLNPLPALDFTSPGDAPETLNGPPFSGGTIDYRIQTTGATEWRWDFGDGTTPFWNSNPTTGPEPSHTYVSTGNYSVTVQIRNCVASAITSNATQVNVTNTTPLVPEMAAQGLFCTGGNCFTDTGVLVTFLDTTQGDPDFFDYDWDGDGNYESIDNPAPITTHTFYEAGTFDPTLRVRRGPQTETFIHDSVIVGGSNLPLPVVTVSGPANGETGQSLTYSVSTSQCSPAPTVWQWNVEDAIVSGSSTAASINLQFPTVGSKTIRATPVNGQCAGVQDTQSVSIAISGAFIFSDNFESGNTSSWSQVIE